MAIPLHITKSKKHKARAGWLSHACEKGLLALLRPFFPDGEPPPVVELAAGDWSFPYASANKCAT